MTEACAKLYELGPNKNRDDSNCGRAFHDVRSKNIEKSPPSQISAVCIDHLFSFSESQRSVTKYCCRSFIENSKTSLHFLTTFEAIITKEVHYLPNNLHARNSNIKNIVEIQISRAQQNLQLQKHSHKTYFCFGKAINISPPDCHSFHVLSPVGSRHSTSKLLRSS